jgi:hypothetical protein
VSLVSSQFLQQILILRSTCSADVLYPDGGLSRSFEWGREVFGRHQLRFPVFGSYLFTF